MEYCLDGYNILFKMAKLAGKNIKSNENFHEFRDSFTARLADYFERRHSNARCYFDGFGENWLIDRKRNIGEYFRIIYVGEVTADEVIIEYIREHQNPRQLVIVTEDNEIASVARAYKCRLTKSSDFINEIPSLAKCIEEAASNRIRIVSKPIKKQKNKPESKPIIRNMHFADIEEKFRNIDMNEILDELSEEDGINYNNE